MDRVASATIVVADDNADLLQMLAWILEAEGYEVHTANDGLAAVELAAEHRPSVMVLDLGMPKLDGYATARVVREQPWGESIWLVAHSGYGRREDKRRAMAAGFDIHLTKPIDPRSLTQLVDRLRRTAERAREPD
jgi:CheY-like chemotaxis protein